MKSLRIVLDLVAAALILITAFFCASCGSPSSDSSDPSGGNDGAGGATVTGGTGGELPPNTTPAVLGPDGQWHCEDGVMIKADESRPFCSTQPITSPPDASTPPDPDGPISTPVDASPPEPDVPISEPDTPSGSWTPREGMEVYCGAHTETCPIHEVSPGMWYCPGSGTPEDGMATENLIRYCSPTPRQ